MTGVSMPSVARFLSRALRSLMTDGEGPLRSVVFFSGIGPLDASVSRRKRRWWPLRIDATVECWRRVLAAAATATAAPPWFREMVRKVEMDLEVEVEVEMLVEERSLSSTVRARRKQALHENIGGV